MYSLLTSHKMPPLWFSCAAMTMVWLLCLFSLLLCLTVKCQGSVELLSFHDSALKPSSQKGVPLAVQVEPQHLNNVSHSVVMAESWLRNHVLAHYPSANITTIIVGHTLLCTQDQHHKLSLILPSIKNIHHSLTRWGLQNHIKVAASLSSNCLDSMSETYRDDIAESHIKPLITILQEIGSPYVVNPLSKEPTTSWIKSHLKSMEINMIMEKKPSRRKLSKVFPFPPRPNPIIAPSHSSNPAYAVGSPLPPLVGTVAPTLPVAPSLPPEANNPAPFLPQLAPMASPPYGPHLPPCGPAHGGAPMHHGLWCVAKPSVPAETLQEALDYACGEGNADCDAIKDDYGSCYYPDTVVAHASYAFNSYWQRTKMNGGTCGFGGTAMLINSDPSYGHCRFVLT